MNISILNLASAGLNISKPISHMFLQLFQSLTPLGLAWGWKVQITWCPWQVLLQQGNYVNPCSAIHNLMWVNSLTGNLEENVLVLCQLEPDGDWNH